MGGCATKPKVVKAEENTGPEPAPVKEEFFTDSDAKIVGGTEEIGAVKVEGGDEEKEKGKEKVDDGDVDKVDEQGNKPRSLGLLLESEQAKESTENDKTTQTEAIPSEPVKQEEPKTQNASIPETEKAENPVVEAPAVFVAAEIVETEKLTEAAPTVETKKPEISEENKTEVKGSAVEDVKVTEEASNIDGRQSEPVLPVSSAEKVVGEVAETK